MTKITEDIYNLLKHESAGLTAKDLDKLAKLVELDIIDNVVETVQAKKDITEISLSFGTLYIKYSDGDIKFKLVPSEEFKKQISECVAAGTSALDAKLNDALVARINHIYKDLIQ